MKNKHLVLLFLLVLLLGLVGRRLPWRCQSDLRGRLVHAPEAIYRIQVSREGQTDLFLEYTAAGWVAEQEGRIVPISRDTMAALFDLLGQLRHFTPLTDKESTRAFATAKPIHLQLFFSDRPPTSLQWGLEQSDSEGPWTLVRIAKQEGVYRVRGAFRSWFDRTIDDFRNRKLLLFDLTQACNIALYWPTDSSVLLEKIDSITWQRASNTPENPYLSFPYWLNAVAQLQNLPFADFFDESREEEWLCLTVVLTACDGKTFTLRFFALEPLDLPEDVRSLHRQGIKALPRYVAHSSANPHNYFALLDAEVGARLCAGP